MRRMVQRRKRRILMMWMKKRQEKRMKMEMKMVRSRMDMQQNDLQRKKRRRMKLIQRDRRQKMGLQPEFSVPIHFCSLHLSSLHSSLCLHCPFSLWLHTISDEEGLEMLSDREEGMGLRASLPPQ